MAARTMAPLTREEQVFAAENHYIVDKYLRKRRLDPNEYYDVVIFRYLRSVKRWFSEPELHVHNFEIVAFYAMRSAIGHYQEKQRRQRKYGTILSLDAAIDGTNGLTFGDSIADPYDAYLQLEYRETVKEHLTQLSPRRRNAILSEVYGCCCTTTRGGGRIYAKSVCYTRQSSHYLCRSAA